MINNRKNNQDLVKKAIYLSNFIAILLFIMKYFNFTVTHSHAIYASALDGFIDMISSLINFITVHFIFLKNDRFFSKGLDKLSSFICFFQSLFVGFFSLHLIQESISNLINHHSEAEHLSVGIPIIILSILINIFLVLYQKKVVAQTGSIIVKTDMIHFSSDIVSHIALLIGVILMQFTNYFWIDSVIAILLCGWVFYALCSVFKQSIYSILDLNFQTEAKKIKNILQENNHDIEKLFVYFTGNKYIIEIFDESNNHEEIKKIIHSIHDLPFSLSGCGCHNSVECEILFIKTY